METQFLLVIVSLLVLFVLMTITKRAMKKMALIILYNEKYFNSF